MRGIPVYDSSAFTYNPTTRIFATEASTLYAQHPPHPNGFGIKSTKTGVVVYFIKSDRTNGDYGWTIMKPSLRSLVNVSKSLRGLEVHVFNT